MLVINDKPGTTCTVDIPDDIAHAPDAAFMHLLGMILAQAYHDDMDFVELGANSDKGTTYLRYGKHQNGAGTQWWDMVPPPAMAYARLVKALVSATEFHCGLRLRGTMHGLFAGEAVSISVDIRDWHCIVCDLSKSPPRDNDPKLPRPTK